MSKKLTKELNKISKNLRAVNDSKITEHSFMYHLRDGFYSYKDRSDGSGEFLFIEDAFSLLKIKDEKLVTLAYNIAFKKYKSKGGYTQVWNALKRYVEVLDELDLITRR